MIDRTKDGSNALYCRDLTGDNEGLQIVVYLMTYGKARVNLGDDISIHNGYCYSTPAKAIEAAKAWDGEGDPMDGWHRNPQTGRRRTDGDPDK